jgi:hypothetical protein
MDSLFIFFITQKEESDKVPTGVLVHHGHLVWEMRKEGILYELSTKR